MKINYVPRSLLVLIVFSATGLLSACGGSGGGGGGPAPQASAPLSLTTSNAGQTADVAVDATSDAGGSSGVDSAFGASVSQAEKFRLVDTINKTLAIVSQADQFYPDTVTGLVISPTVVACDFAGTATISGNVNDNFLAVGFVAGDVFSMNLSNCSYTPGEVLNGFFSMRFIQVVGDILEDPFYTYQASMNAGNYTVVSGTESIFMDGDALFFLDVNASGDEVRLSGNRLTLSADTVLGVTLFDYDFIETRVSATDAYTSELNGIVDSQELDGSIEIVTIVPLQGVGTSAPESGQFRIIGSENSNVLVTALGGDAVRLETDSDGDGVVDVGGTENTTWSNLDLL